MIALGQVSSCIYLIQKGQVEVSYQYVSKIYSEQHNKDRDNKLLQFDAGSYIGDTSYIFRILNQYSYRPKQSSVNGLMIYSLNEKYLSQIFKNFP